VLVVDDGAADGRGRRLLFAAAGAVHPALAEVRGQTRERKPRSLAALVMRRHGYAVGC
jgi:hypothetical protein